MAESERDLGVKRLVSEALLLALVPVIGSVIAAAFEFGYAVLVFELPTDVIQVDIVGVVFAVLGMVMLLVPLGCLGLVLFWGMYSDNTVVRVLTVIIPLGGISMLTGPVLMKGMLGAMVVGMYVLIVKSKSVWNKRLDNVERLKSLEPKEYRQQVAAMAIDVRQTESRAGLLVAGMAGSGLSAVMLSAMLAGGLVARHRGTYYAIADEPSFILVRKYGSEYHFKEVDTATGKIGNNVRVRAVSDLDSELKLKQVTIPELTGNGWFAQPRRSGWY